MTCAIIGDSIADGLAALIPDCIVDAKVGIPSVAIIDRVHGADVLIVSAGSNDPNNPSLQANLEKIREKATGSVIWIRPNMERAAAAVMAVASRHGDMVVSFTAGRDKVHPKNYKTLARELKSLI